MACKLNNSVFKPDRWAGVKLIELISEYGEYIVLLVVGDVKVGLGIKVPLVLGKVVTVWEDTFGTLEILTGGVVKVAVLTVGVVVSTVVVVLRILLGEISDL